MESKIKDSEKVKSICASISEAAEKLQPHADGLDEIFGTMLRSAFHDLRQVESDLWASVESIEEEKKEEKGTIALVRIYGDDEVGLQDVVVFTDIGEAHKFANDIRDDDGLAGISKVDVDEQYTDEKGIGEWWKKVAEEGGLEDLRDAWPTEGGRNVGL